MSDSRRSFFHTAAALAAGWSGAGDLAAQERPAASLKAQTDLQSPKMKFGKVEISRLIAGCNPFYGFSHFNPSLNAVMREYYTPERVCEVLHQCNRFGINAFNMYPGGRGPADLERFLAEGGAMHLIVQGIGDIAGLMKTYKPLSVYHHGETTDRAFQNGTMSTVKEWCKRMRDTGSMVGVGTHKPEVIELVEAEGWDVDFYAGCVYNRTRTPEEWKRVLGGNLVEMQGECYLQNDPARMYKVMRATPKPCFAFKILAAGRVTNVEQAFRTAYESIKPIDGIFIGLFPRVVDEVREDAERVRRILAEG